MPPKPILKKQNMDDEAHKWDLLPDITDTYEQLTPPEMMISKVENMAWIQYADILKELKILIEDIRTTGKPAPGTLESVMINWLEDVAPDEVTCKRIKQIHKYACAISDKL